MTIQALPIPSSAAGTAEGPRLRVGLIVLVVVIAAAVAAGLVYRAFRTEYPPTYSSEQLQAMAALTLPSQFDRVDTAWACASNEQSACFTSLLSSQNAVEALARAMGAREYTTVPGSGGAPAQYHFCTTVASAPASVIVAALPTNAVDEGGLWIVPPDQEPKYGGSVVNVHLTGPVTCP